MKVKNVKFIGGGTPCFIADIAFSDNEANFARNYRVAIAFSRHGQQTQLFVFELYYVRSLRKFVGVIPKSQSSLMRGYYTCSLRVLAPDGVLFQPMFINTSVM